MAALLALAVHTAHAVDDLTRDILTVGAPTARGELIAADSNGELRFLTGNGDADGTLKMTLRD